MSEILDTIHTIATSGHPSIIPAVERDTLCDSTTHIALMPSAEVRSDSLLSWGRSLELDTTKQTITELRFEGLKYKFRIGDSVFVQIGFLLFLIVLVLFLSRGQGYITRSFKAFKNIFLKGKQGDDYRYLRAHSNEETSVLLRIQTLILYSFTIVYYYYYYSDMQILSFGLFVFMGQVSGAAFLLSLFISGTDHALGYLFNERDLMAKYIKVKTLLSELSSFLLWIVVLTLVYSDVLKPMLFGVIIGIFVITKIIEWTVAIFIFSKGVHTLLDFILYLCTAEIIPYFLFYQLVEYCYSQSVI